MTAAENVLGWLLIEKIGVPDDRNYSPNEAQEILVRRLDYANEMENERIRSALHPAPTPVSAPVGESQTVSLNGRTVELTGLALEVMRAMDKSEATAAREAFKRGFDGGRRSAAEDNQ